ncbi:MAG TPA: MFS transporter [Actinomycetota bacterium]|nr:MFS transporter [Actinomycetota bacterium]
MMGQVRIEPDARRASVRASIAGAVAAIVLTVLVFAGSNALRNFDAALIGYAAATIVLAFGVVYRYAMWVQTPPTRRYLVKGWRAFFSFRNFRRFPSMVPRGIVGYLGLQTFIRHRGTARWVAHQALFWGVVIATLMTFTLAWGWIHFEATETQRYEMFVLNLGVMTFAPLTWWAWIAFHVLDIAAVLVIAGCGYFLWRRMRDREATTGQRLGYDFLPLVALVAISVTGLLLTFSSALLEGAGYEFLAILHMGVVVLSLIFIPFGKFFHVIQRPATVGVHMYKRTSQAAEGIVECERCGEPLEGAEFVRNLQETMDELGLEYRDLVQTCPRCKRLERGKAYLDHVKRGF